MLIAPNENFGTWLLRMARACRSALWFRPAIFSLVSVLCVVILAQLDSLGMIPFTGEIERNAMKAMLRALAGGMLTVITVTVSVLALVLSIAAGNASPRALPELMADPISQNTLTTFMATLVYALAGLTLLEYRDVSSGARVVLGAIALILIALVLRYLVQLVDHVANSIKLNRVVERIFRDADEALENLLESRAKPDREAHDTGDRAGTDVFATDVGYIQLIDLETIAGLVEEHDLIVHLLHREGDFLHTGIPAMQVFSSASLSDNLVTKLRHTVSTGAERSMEGDPYLGVELLTEIASRSLSPGINDPQSAIVCIKYLGALLYRAGKVPPEDYPATVLAGGRLSVRPILFRDMLKRAVRPIMKDGAGRPEVLFDLLSILNDLAERVAPDYLDKIGQEAETIKECAADKLIVVADREEIDRRTSAIAETIECRRGEN